MLAHPAVTIVLPGIAALFGTDEDDRFRLLDATTMKNVLEADGAREIVALLTLGEDITLGDICTPVQPGAPVYTNDSEVFAAAILLAPRYSRTLCTVFDPPAKTLLAIFPAQTRIIWSPIDTPEVASVLRELAQESRTVEGEDFLSAEVARFDGERWLPAEAS